MDEQWAKVSKVVLERITLDAEKIPTNWPYTMDMSKTIFTVYNYLNGPHWYALAVLAEALVQRGGKVRVVNMQTGKRVHAISGPGVVVDRGADAENWETTLRPITRILVTAKTAVKSIDPAELLSLTGVLSPSSLEAMEAVIIEQEAKAEKLIADAKLLVEKETSELDRLLVVVEDKTSTLDEVKKVLAATLRKLRGLPISIPEIKPEPKPIELPVVDMLIKEEGI